MVWCTVPAPPQNTVRVKHSESELLSLPENGHRTSFPLSDSIGTIGKNRCLAQEDLEKKSDWNNEESYHVSSGDERGTCSRETYQRLNRQVT